MVGYSLNGVSGSAGVSLISESVIRDIKLVLVSFIVTCIIIAAYNYSLQQRVLRSSDKTKVNDICFHFSSSQAAIDLDVLCLIKQLSRANTN